MDTKSKVQAIVEDMKRINPKVHSTLAGVRGHVISVGTDFRQSVYFSMKLWRGYDKDLTYTVVFSMTVGEGATETQIIDATKRLVQFQQRAPKFTAEETDAVFAALAEICPRDV
jgi:hypothetical protein